MPPCKDEDFPQLGTVGAIVEIYSNEQIAYEVEFSDPNGCTTWLGAIPEHCLSAITPAA